MHNWPSRLRLDRKIPAKWALDNMGRFARTNPGNSCLGILDSRLASLRPGTRIKAGRNVPRCDASTHARGGGMPA
jgi:hypothetical protein